MVDSLKLREKARGTRLFRRSFQVVDTPVLVSQNVPRKARSFGLSPINICWKVCALVDSEVKRIIGLRMPLSVPPGCAGGSGHPN